MRLLFNNLLLRLAFHGLLFWDSPASEMGVVIPDDGGAGGGDDRKAGDATDDDVDGQDDDQHADDERGDADASTRRGSARGDDDDQDDEDEDEDRDEDDDVSRPAEERLKKVLKAKRRLERQGKKLRPVRERLKELEAAGLSIDDLIHSHRSLASLQRRLEESPKLRALLEENDDAPASRDARAAKGGKRESVKYPFKTDNESGKFFENFHQDFTNHRDEVSTRLERLEKLLEGEVRERTGERTTAAVKEWRGHAETASKLIPEGFRDLFMHAIGLEMRRALRGEIKASPQQVIDAHLAKLKKKGAITDVTKKRASEAARESIARRNETLPRRPSGSGAPGPVKERQIPRMSDFNRKLKARFGGS